MLLTWGRIRIRWFRVSVFQQCFLKCTLNVLQIILTLSLDCITLSAMCRHCYVYWNMVHNLELQPIMSLLDYGTQLSTPTYYLIPGFWSNSFELQMQASLHSVAHNLQCFILINNKNCVSSESRFVNITKLKALQNVI